jgi:hypothetical protein
VSDRAYEHYDLDHEYATTVLSVNEAYETPSQAKSASPKNELLLAPGATKPGPQEEAKEKEKIAALVKNLTDMGYAKDLAASAVEAAT